MNSFVVQPIHSPYQNHRKKVDQDIADGRWDFSQSVQVSGFVLVIGWHAEALIYRSLQQEYVRNLGKIPQVITDSILLCVFAG